MSAILLAEAATENGASAIFDMVEIFPFDI